MSSTRHHLRDHIRPLKTFAAAPMSSSPVLAVPSGTMAASIDIDTRPHECVDAVDARRADVAPLHVGMGLFGLGEHVIDPAGAERLDDFDEVSVEPLSISIAV